MNWHPYPMVRVLIPLAIGIYWGTYSNSGPGLGLLAILFLLISFVGLSGKVFLYRWFGVTWMIWVFLAGWGLIRGSDPVLQSDHWLHASERPTADTQWKGKVANVKRGEKWVRVTMALEAWAPLVRDSFLPVGGKILLYFPVSEFELILYQGDNISVSGLPKLIAPPMDPMSFDWRNYQRLRGVTHQLFVFHRNWAIQQSDQPSLMGRFQKWRNQFGTVLDHYLKEPESRQLARAMILGDREEFSESLNEAYVASGAVHILAVSGLHVGLVAGMIMAVLGLLLRHRRLFPLKAFLAVGAVWAYVLLTGAADSAVRAGVLFSVLLLGRSLSRHAESLNLLAAAVVFLLLYDPWMLHHVGFQLSVAAVAGILFFQPLLYKSWYPGDRVSLFFWNLFCVTVAAQLTTLMMGLFYFHRFPLYFLLAGLFVVPLASIFLGTGVITVLLHPVSAELAKISSWFLEKQALLMNSLVGSIADLPKATLWDIYPMVIWVILVPIITGFALYGWFQKHAPSIVKASIWLAAGCLAQAGHTLWKSSSSEWYVLRERDNPSHILTKQGDQLWAINLSEDSFDIQQQHWPGWGKVNVLSREKNFRIGNVQKQGDLLVMGKDSLTWGWGRTGQLYLVLPGFDPPDKENLPKKLLVLPELLPKERWPWRQLSNTHAVMELRETGYWQQPISFVSVPQ